MEIRSIGLQTEVNILLRDISFDSEIDLMIEEIYKLDALVAELCAETKTLIVNYPPFTSATKPRSHKKFVEVVKNRNVRLKKDRARKTEIWKLVKELRGKKTEIENQIVARIKK